MVALTEEVVNEKRPSQANRKLEWATDQPKDHVSKTVTLLSITADLSRTKARFHKEDVCSCQEKQ
jgi:predicted negative regulator of RcsB-dependent stress response